jgi:pimeloyl-ACP methyl ester carboxylesterase
MRFALPALLLLIGIPVLSVADADPLERWLLVNGVRIHFREAVPAPGTTGPTLLMVHGWTGAADDFRHLFDLLPKGWRAIAVDLPGCGMSEKPDAVYDLPYFVDFLRAFVDALGLEKLVLVGHSMGGQFAVHFATRWPGSVEKLVLIAPDGLKGEEGVWLALARWESVVDFAFRLNNRLFIEWAVRANLFFRPTTVMVREAVDSASSILGPEGSRAIARITRRVIGHDPVDELLPQVRQETLVLWGDHDKVLEPKWAARFLDLLPRARLVWIAASSHMPMREKPVEVAAALVEFIRT